MTTTFKASYRARRFETLRATFRLIGLKRFEDTPVRELDATNAALRQMDREGL